MCARISNLRSELRDNLPLPNGVIVCPKQLEERFGDIDSHERGRLSGKVLSSIPTRERRSIREWASRKTKADRGMIELLVFYAAAHAVQANERVHDVVHRIAAAGSCVGVLLEAAA